MFRSSVVFYTTCMDISFEVNGKVSLNLVFVPSFKALFLCELKN